VDRGWNAGEQKKAEQNNVHRDGDGQKNEGTSRYIYATADTTTLTGTGSILSPTVKG
jgi:hypothetical protein